MDTELRTAIRTGDIRQINKIRRRLGETGPHGPIFPGDRVKVVQYHENGHIPAFKGAVGTYRGIWKDGGSGNWDNSGISSNSMYDNEAWIELDTGCLHLHADNYPHITVSRHQPVFKVELLEEE